MDENRVAALERLNAGLTETQKIDLKLVIETAEVQGDYFYDEDDGSVWSDSVNSTLMQLSNEFKRITHDE